SGRRIIDGRSGQLRAYLDEQHASYIDDETNADVTIPRNRVRVELLPLLEARFNAGIVDVLADEAQIARDEWAWMVAAADIAHETVARGFEGRARGGERPALHRERARLR